MKKTFNTGRLGILVWHFVALVLLFMLEKPLFMLYAGGLDGEYGIADWLQVVLHGLSIDLSVASYLTLFPLVAAIVSVLWLNFPFKTVIKVYDMLASVLLSLIFIGDAVLYPFWGFKLDASVLMYLQTPKEAVASVQPLTVVVGLLLVALSAWLFYKALSLPLGHKVCAIEPVKRKSACTVGLVLLILPLFLAIRGGMGQSTMNIGHAYFSSDSFLNHSAVNPGFSLISSLSKTDDYSKWYDYYPEEERSRLADSLYMLEPDAGSAKLLRVSRPDVLLVILEGFGADFISELGGMEQVSPNLDRIIREGVSFDSCYAGSFRTDRGLVCVVNGHPGLPTVSLMKMPVKCSKLPSISETLSRDGYVCDFIYGGDINFTNMNSWLYGAGYSKVISSVDFSSQDSHASAWGAYDEVVFSRALEEISNREPDTSWFTTILSLSSHEPFEVPYHRLSDMIPNAFAYTDSCLGAFVDSLRTRSLWDNLLLVITSDHGFRYPSAGHPQAAHVHHIPLIMTGGALQCDSLRFGQTMNQTDIAATLLGQLGYGHSDFKFSRDVLSEGYDNRFAFYTFNNGFCYIDSTGVSMYDAASDTPIDGEGVAGGDLRISKGRALLQTLHDDLGGR